MSGIQNDLDESVYIGLELPLTHSKTGFFNRTTTALQQSKSNIKNLLLTKKGERLANPLFGSDLYKVIFEQEGDDLESKVEEAIRSSISQWLPFIMIENVQVAFSSTNRNAINISIKFAINTDPTTLEQLSIDLENYQNDIEGTPTPGF